MTTSNAYAYAPNTATIINRALRQCGAYTQGEAPGAADVQDSLDALNAMVKSWQVEGINVWAEIVGTIFLQPGQAVYNIGVGTTDAVTQSGWSQTALSATATGASVSVGSVAGIAAGYSIGVQLDAGTNFWTTIAGISGTTVTLAVALPSQATSGALVFCYAPPLVRPLRVPAARRMVLASGIETPMIPLSRIDYANLPNKSNSGLPTQFFFDPQLNQAQVSVWQAPADNTAVINFTAQRPLQDFSTVANTPDFPIEWTAALAWGLAVEIAPEYDVPAERFAVLKDRAAEHKMIVRGWNKEPEPLLFGVAFQPGYR